MWLHSKGRGVAVNRFPLKHYKNYLENEEIEAFVKYNYFHKEQKRSYKKNAFLVDNLFYNEEKDFFVCPKGQRLNYAGTTQKTTELDFEYQVSIYQAGNCNGCPLRDLCYKAKGNKRIEVNHNLNRLRKIAKQKLLSDIGIFHRGERPIESEAVFGHIN